MSFDLQCQQLVDQFDTVMSLLFVDKDSANTNIFEK